MGLVRRYVVDTVQATDKAYGNTRALGLSREGGSLTVRMDASWAPYIQASMQNIAVPSAADLTAIDPRAGWRGGFRVRSFDGVTGAQLASFATSLGIRSRTRTYTRGPGAALALELGGDEALLQDYLFGEALVWPDPAAPALASQWASQRATAAGMSLRVVTGAPDANMVGADIGWSADQSAWDYISGLAEAAGARVWVAEWGELLWSSPTYVGDTTTRSIDGIFGVSDVVSRDAPDWGNLAVVSYQASGNYVTSDSGLTPRKGIAVTRRGRRPATGGATKVRVTAQSHGRNLTIDHLADLDMRPQQKRTATYQGVSWTGTVQSMAWTFPAGTQQTVLNVIE